MIEMIFASVLINLSKKSDDDPKTHFGFQFSGNKNMYCVLLWTKQGVYFS